MEVKKISSTVMVSDNFLAVTCLPTWYKKNPTWTIYKRKDAIENATNKALWDIENALECEALMTALEYLTLKEKESEKPNS